MLMTIAEAKKTPEKTPCKGYIEACALSETTPQYAIFYNGMHIYSDAEGFYTLPSVETSSPLNLLICKRTIEKKEHEKESAHTTIRHFIVPEGENYKFYADITKKNIPEQTELTNNEIPYNTIVICMDPAHIDSIAPWEISLCNKLIKLPKIVLSNRLSHTELSYSAQNCSLYALDIARWHAPVKNQGSVSI